MSNPKRAKIALVCEECSARNYHTDKARKAGNQQRLGLKKFCPSCKRHTLHRESK